MAKEQPTRKPYPSDLTDAQWTILEPLMPAAHTPRGGRPREVDLREIVNTILYLNRSGCPWEMLPHDLLPKSTVYDYFARWRDDGTWVTLRDDFVLGRRQTHHALAMHLSGGIDVAARQQERELRAQLVLRLPGRRRGDLVGCVGHVDLSLAFRRRARPPR